MPANPARIAEAVERIRAGIKRRKPGWISDEWCLTVADLPDLIEAVALATGEREQVQSVAPSLPVTIPGDDGWAAVRVDETDFADGSIELTALLDAEAVQLSRRQQSALVALLSPDAIDRAREEAYAAGERAGMDLAERLALGSQLPDWRKFADLIRAAIDRKPGEG
jgi:hypothetical protein